METGLATNISGIKSTTDKFRFTGTGDDAKVNAAGTGGTGGFTADDRTNLGAVKTNTDKLQFNSANDVKATLDGESVTTDAASRTASKADVSGLPTLTELATVDTVVDAIKAKTDKLQFTSSNDVKATLDGESVTTDAASRTASKADVSSLATSTALTTVDTVVDAIKAKTDDLNFVGDDVKATLDGEQVTTDAASRTASKANVSNLATTTQLDNGIADIEDGQSAIQTNIFARITAVKNDTAKIIKLGENKLIWDGTTMKILDDDEDEDNPLYEATIDEDGNRTPA